ncbi:MAG: type VI secretion system amidase effector protein Tae4 [Burkholderiales bacterium]|nr:type VI secretion system amidase effector protein Tae4 [Burkholderiales bacterium]
MAEKNINAPGFGPNGNTCASRLSVAFNKAGAPVNAALASAVGAQTLGTAYGSRIIYRVADFRRYLLKVLGKPTIDDTGPYDDSFRSRQGIIAFSVNWQGATGHIALWNGAAYREPSHDNYSTYINSTNPNIRTSLGEFWEIS